MTYRLFIFFIFFMITSLQAQEDNSISIDETVESDDADWDNFADELEGGLEKSTSPSKVPAKSTSKVSEQKNETKKETKEENDFDDEWEKEFKPEVTETEDATKTKAEVDPTNAVSNEDSQKENSDDTFDLGAEENELIQLSQVVSTQISDEEWRSISQSSPSTTTYEVKKNDWLFKISKNLFGSGLYYPKIWSLNPHITNPHEIEPGVLLVFDPGSAILPPSLSIGDIAAGETSVVSSVGTPRWFEEKKKLMAKGIEVISSDEELAKVMGDKNKNEEYKKYTPPQAEVFTPPPADLYDSFGVDKGSLVKTEFKQGHYLNTFIATNEIKVFGEFTDMIHEAMYQNVGFKVYIILEEGVTGQAGDLYSVFSNLGKVESKNSERTGEKYVINGTVKLLQQIDVENRKWEAAVTEIFVPVQRGGKLTSYTPKINKVFKTYNSRVIEGTIITGYRELNSYFTMGDIVYLDRGRADGVEVGNVFDTYDSLDRGEDRSIASKPVYRTGELTIISVTDNFSTAFVSNAVMDFKIGDLVRTRSSEEEQVARSNAKPRVPGVEQKDYTSKSVGDDIFSKVSTVSLSAQELAELERQQAQKDVLDSTERDLKELEELEQTISQADQLITTQLTEDQLANKDLEDIEGQVYQQGLKVNLDSLEQRYGKKYLDQDLESVENPFGLSQYDVEEVDELLNMQKTNDVKQDKIDSQSSAPMRKKNSLDNKK